MIFQRTMSELDVKNAWQCQKRSLPAKRSGKHQGYILECTTESYDMTSVKRVGRITQSIDKTTTHAAQSDFHAVLIRQPHARTNDINARPFRITACQSAREGQVESETLLGNLPVHVHSSAQWDDEVRNAVRDLSGRFSTTEGDRDRRGGTRSGECHRIRWDQLLVKLDCISASEAIVQ